MSRPGGPEGDLSGILGQVNALRQQRGLAHQTLGEYRGAITNHVNGLLAICSQPDIQAILASHRPESGAIFPHSAFFPPIVGYITNGSRFSPEKPRDQGYSPPLFLDTRESSGGKVEFVLEFMQSRFSSTSKRQDMRATLNDALQDQANTTGNLNVQLQLNPLISWQLLRVSPTGDGDYRNITFVSSKALTAEDFMQHPEWLEIFDSSLATVLSKAHDQTAATMSEQQRRTAQFTSPPIEQVVADLKAHTGDYSPVDLMLVAQNAAGTALENAPALPQGVSEERVRQIVAEMITERLAAIQLSPQNQELYTTTPDIDRSIHQFAQGDQVAETLMRRFLRRSRDPQRVFQTLMALSQLIPGTTQLRAILEATNIMFGPETETR